MKKFILVIFLFLFLSPNNFIKRNIAEAFSIPPPYNLRATTTCAINDRTGTNTISTINFQWDVVGGTNYHYRLSFFKTGDSSETDLPDGVNNIIQSGLPYNTTYAWYVKMTTTDFCLWDCSITVNGPPVTSLTCPTTTPIPTPTPTLPPPTEGNYDCSNRKPACASTTDYPSCRDFLYTASWSCYSPNCTMYNTADSNNNNWTKSCAYYKTQPTPAYCRPEGDRNCTNTSNPPQGDCCVNLICQPPTGRTTAFGDGTCVAAPPSLGGSCITCLPTSFYVNGKCLDKTTGAETSPVSSMYCNTTTQTCVQGQGCITNSTSPTCNIVGGCTTTGTYKLKCGFDPQNPGAEITCSTAIGRIKTSVGGFINSLFAKVLGIVGGIAVLLIIISGYRLMTSQGNPEKVQGAREQLTAAIVGLLFVIFSLVILEMIGYDILRLPGFLP